MTPAPDNPGGRFSVLILTRDEERNLPGCLESVAWCDDVVVLDSGSADRTVAIARERGARVLSRPFTDFADQRNWAHAQEPFRHDWVFHLDADEQFTPALRAECAAVASRPPDAIDGFLVAPRMVFMGRWIRHCTDYPAYQTRFVRAKDFRFVQVGHGQREAPEMRVGRLAAGYNHLLSAATEAEWEEKHRRYARAEAALIRSRTLRLSSDLAVFFGHSPLERRRALKRLWLRLPARPALRFAWQYLVRGGFLDGRPGLCYCVRLSRYERMIAEALRRPA